MSSSPSQFLAVALSSANPSFALSYADPDQRRVIRKHLLLLLQEYPSFSLSTESFTHDNGTTVWLLNAGGYLHVSSSAPRIHVMIWVHEDYPYMAPKVFVVSENPINKNHPFVKPCGSVVSTYERTWEYPGSNLKDLVHNLVKLFSHHHPFFTVPGSKLSHPTLASRREAMDRLVGSLYSDVVAINDDAREELEQLGALKKAVSDLATDADMLMNWLKVHHPKFGAPDSVNEMAEKAFEAADEVSGLVMEALAADRAVEDVIYALEKGLEESVLSPEVYVKQVRSLAREQFHHKEMLIRIRACDRHDI